jgi:predicted amidohydrolase
MTKHKIAAFPFDVRPGEVATNLREALVAVEQAASGGAKLLVLPEKWTTSFMPSFTTAMREDSEAALVELHKVALAADITVVGSAPGGSGDKPSNELHFLGTAGNLRPYRKRMLFSPTGEGRQVDRGDGLPVSIETPVGKVCALVCYDLRFPEVCRPALYEQADLLVCVAQWPNPRVRIFELMSRCRAAENQLWTISCNRDGIAGLDEKLMHFPGMALCVDPLGEISDRVDDGSLLICEVDYAEADKVRKTVPLARDLQKAGLWPRG